MKIGTSSKVVDLLISGRFRGLAHSFFWLRGRFQRLMTQGPRKLGVVKTRRFGHFWPFSWASTQFLAPGTISTARDPGYTKIGTSSKLVDYVISGRFRGL